MTPVHNMLKCFLPISVMAIFTKSVVPEGGGGGGAGGAAALPALLPGGARGAVLPFAFQCDSHEANAC